MWSAWHCCKLQYIACCYSSVYICLSNWWALPKWLNIIYMIYKLENELLSGNLTIFSDRKSWQESDRSVHYWECQNAEGMEKIHNFWLMSTCQISEIQISETVSDRDMVTLVDVSSVVITTAVSCLEKLVSNITCSMSGGMSNLLPYLALSWADSIRATMYVHLW